jgi:hypothetical protein
VYSVDTGLCRTSASRGSAELGAIASNSGKEQAPDQRQISDPLQFMMIFRFLCLKVISAQQLLIDYHLLIDGTSMI